MAKKTKMGVLDWIAIVLLTIGGLNWGLVGISGLLNISKIDLVQMLFGSIPVLRYSVYLLVGLASAYSIIFLARKAMGKI